jgi:hypothetical protein
MPKRIAILLGSAALALLPSNAAGQFNNPPVTTNDTATTGRCGIVTRDVVANDSDPDGDYPLALTQVYYNGAKGTAFAVSSTSIEFEASDATGTAAISYTVSDSRGATATGTFTVTINSVFMCW